MTRASLSLPVQEGQVGLLLMATKVVVVKVPGLRIKQGCEQERAKDQSRLSVSLFRLLPSSSVRGQGRSCLSRPWASTPLSGVRLRKSNFVSGWKFFFLASSHLFTGAGSNAEIIDDVTNLLVLVLTDF